MDLRRFRVRAGRDRRLAGELRAGQQRRCKAEIAQRQRQALGQPDLLAVHEAEEGQRGAGRSKGGGPDELAFAMATTGISVVMTAMTPGEHITSTATPMASE